MGRGSRQGIVDGCWKPPLLDRHKSHCFFLLSLDLPLLLFVYPLVFYSRASEGSFKARSTYVVITLEERFFCIVLFGTTRLGPGVEKGTADPTCLERVSGGIECLPVEDTVKITNSDSGLG